MNNSVLIKSRGIVQTMLLLALLMMPISVNADNCSPSNGGTIASIDDAVVAVPAPCYKFSHWEMRDCCGVSFRSTNATLDNYSRVMAMAKSAINCEYCYGGTQGVTFTAYFTKICDSFTVTSISNDPTMGSVNGGGQYASGTMVTLTAVSKPNCHFVRWNDNNTDSIRSITVTGDLSLTAYFEANELADSAHCLRFKAVDGPATIALNQVGSPNAISLVYSVDNCHTWNNYVIGNVIQLSTNNVVYFRATSSNATFSKDDTNHYTFAMTGKIAADGNIMSLLNYRLHQTVVPTCGFIYLFYGCNSLITTPRLPATTVEHWAYARMFYGCGLKSMPNLPATNLLEGCYIKMFENCSNLTSVTSLPATNIPNWCYNGMFVNCTSLETIPDLPAATLSEHCYDSMFSGCTSLVINSTEPGTEWRIPATTTATDALANMFTGTSGTMNGTPSVNTTYYIASDTTPITPTAANPLCFTARNGSVTVRFDIRRITHTIQYSTDGTNWNTYVSNTDVPLNANQKVFFRAATNQTTAIAFGDYYYLSTDSTNSSRFFLSSNGGKVECSGNIMSLYGPDCPNLQLQQYAFANMFSDCVLLTTAPELPSTTVAEDSYSRMFVGCTALTTAPALPATTLARYCYYYMFSGCTSLTTPPALPATTMASLCYNGLFSGCTSLMTVPALPATILADNCYSYMFDGCTSLVVNTSGPGKEWTISATTTATDALANMFTGTSGTMNGTPSVNTSYYIASDTTCIPLCFTAKNGSVTVKFEIKNATHQIQYSTNGTSWTNYTSNTDVVLNANGKVYFRAATNQTNPIGFGNNTVATCSRFYFTSTDDGTIEASGNMMSLFGPNCPDITLPSNAFRDIFHGCTLLITPPLLPSTNLGYYCYAGMFNGCSALAVAPKLPAMVMTEYCYGHMFFGCTSLTTPPSLPAMSLMTNCYRHMFDSCASLSSVPSLPATTLADYCYFHMFNGCTSLAVNTYGPGTQWEIPATTTSGLINPLTDMFAGTSGTMNGTPSVNTTYYISVPDTTPIPTPAGNPLCFTARNGSVTVRFEIKKVTHQIEYSTDGISWNNYTSNINVTLNANKKVFFRAKTNQTTATAFGGDNTTIGLQNSSRFYFSSSNGGQVEGTGNIMSLYGPGCPDLQLQEDAFAWMFYQCGLLITPPALPATKLGTTCYENMFNGCSSLKVAPVLPAVNLSMGCYDAMFENCISLVTPPELPATSLKSCCYGSMFKGCTSLSTLPTLPAITLAWRCYYSMFEGCTSLRLNKVGNGKQWKIPALTTVNEALTNMFTGTSGTMNGTPSVNTTYYIQTTRYTVTVNSNNPSFGSVIGGGQYAPGSTVTLTAIPNPNCHFVYWDFYFKGNSDNPKQITVSKDTSFVAVFDSTTTAIDTSNVTSFKMIRVNGGTYQMGSASGNDDEKPVHTVTLNDYYIGETEVTQALWKLVMDSTVSQQRDKVHPTWGLRGEGNNYPMYYLTWNDCQRFISKLNAMTGKTFAMPTEAQWEFAARGGNKSQGYIYSGGNNLNDVGWNWNNSGDVITTGDWSNWNQVPSINCRIHPVAQKMPNELGIYDMSGNVWEYCSDWCGTYSGSSVTNPAGPSAGSERILRGGSWGEAATHCRSTARFAIEPDFCGEYGLRLVLLNEDSQDSVITISLSEDTADYLCIKTTRPNNDIQLNREGTSSALDAVSVEYSTDGIAWNTYTFNSPITLANIGDSVMFRGNNTSFSQSGSDYFNFQFSDTVEVSGNIMTLVDKTGTSTTIPNDHCFTYLFKWCWTMKSAPKLPATTLKNNCYEYMFAGCRNITKAPALPATTLAPNCYNGMFTGCWNLKEAPSLPATNLAYNCYASMFAYCTSLTETPALPADTLAESCYSNMFSYCENLTTIQSLPATALANECYRQMFLNCTSLTDVPYLPATTLKDGCYNGMFRGCTSVILNTSGTGKQWIIPATTTSGISVPLALMFNGTSGTMNGTPSVNTPYYVVSSLAYVPLNFKAVNGSASVRFDIKNATHQIEYSTDGSTWNDYVSNTNVALNNNQKVFFRAAANQTTASAFGLNYFDNGSRFYFTTTDGGSVEGSGNIMSLYGPDYPDLPLQPNAFSYMFYNCKSLTTPPLLPSTNLADSCYASMFFLCSSLTKAPELPATIMKRNCYWGMFANCTSLTAAPELPATDLEDGCYATMFSSCRALVTPPVLPATTMKNSCYTSMFSGCSSLATAPELPAMTLANDCYNGMFANCTTLTETPQLPAVNLDTNCYYSMFMNCSSLTAPPVLPASTLSEACYHMMFENCNSLVVNLTGPGREWIIPATTIADRALTNMLYGTGGTVTGTPSAMTTYYLTSIAGEYIVTLGVNDTAMGKAVGSGQYSDGEEATLIAIPNAAHRFVNWSNGKTTPTIKMTVHGDSTLTANFVAVPSYFYPETHIMCQGETYSWHNKSLTVSGVYYDSLKTVLGEDSVYELTLTVNPTYFIEESHEICQGETYNWHNRSLKTAGVYYDSLLTSAGCDSIYELTLTISEYVVSLGVNDITLGSVNGMGTFDCGDTATVTATATAGSHFVRWSNGATTPTINVVVTSDTALTANFATSDRHYVCAIPNDAGFGSVSGSGLYAHGTSATLTAVANQNSHFVCWNNGATTPAINVVVSSDTVLVANFASSTVHYVAALSNDAAMGSVSGSGLYAHGETAMLTATAKPRHHFVSWSNGSNMPTINVPVLGDSILTATFAANPAYFYPETHAICQGETYNWHGKSLTSAGVYYDSLKTVLGEDSVYELTLTVNPTYFIEESHEICQGGTYNWHGKSLTAAGVYYDSLLTAAGCDSVYEMTLTISEYVVSLGVNDITLGSVNGMGTFDCGDTATVTATATAGSHFVRWSNGATTPTINVVVTSDTALTANFATSDRHYVCAIPNDAGFGSVSGSGLYAHGTSATLTAVANQNGHFVCWNNGATTPAINVVVSSDTVLVANFASSTVHYVAALTNDSAMGSVSGSGLYAHGETATLTATAKPRHHFVSWSNGSNMPTINVPVLGDSILTATFAANPAYFYPETHAICQGETYSWHGKSLTSAGVYYDSLKTVLGEDSVYELTLTVNPTYFIEESHAICQGETYNWHNRLLTTAGVYYDSLLTDLGCDSVYELTLTVNPTYFIEESHTICQGQTYNWHNKSLTTAGVYHDSLLTAAGCDSVYELILTVNPTYFYPESQAICQGETYNWHNKSLTAAGVYYDSLNTLLGCDSIYELTLTVNPTYFFEEAHTICQDQTYSWHSKSLTAAGVYYDSLLTLAGCDSVYELTLTVNPTFFIEEAYTICQGQTYNWHSKSLTTSGVYYDSLLTIAGCDSVYELTLTVNPTYFIEESHTICQGQTYNWHNKSLTTAGVYYDSLLTMLGCDSVFELTLTVNPTYFYPEAHAICQGGTYNWHNRSLTAAGVYYDSLLTLAGCDSVYELTLTVNPTYYTKETEKFCGEPFIWHGQTVTSTGTYYDYLMSSAGCDSTYELTVTSDEYTITANSSNSAAGAAYCNDNGSQKQQMTVNCGNLVEIHAVANQGYHFVGWSDGDADDIRNVEVTSDTSLVAMFDPNCDEWAEWPVRLKYNSLFILDLDSIAKLGYNPLPGDVSWWKVFGEPDNLDATFPTDDQFICNGHYMSLITNNLSYGKYYAVVDVSKTENVLCHDKMRTVIVEYTYNGQHVRIEMAPTNVKNGDVMTISGLVPYEESTIMVYDNAGKLIETIQSNGSERCQITATGSAGVYMVNVVSDSVNETVKFIVTK